ncbi:MAG: helix-turn-helix domain-containing protein [Eubacteriales bacterium]
MSPALCAAIRCTEQSFCTDYGIGILTAHCYISASRLYHLFQSELCRTLIRFRNGLRMKKAARESGKGSRSVEENAELCGFPFAAHSRKIFRAVTGMTPAGHRGLVRGTIEESVRGVLKREPDRSTGLKSVFRISSLFCFSTLFSDQTERYRHFFSKTPDVFFY